MPKGSHKATCENSFMKLVNSLDRYKGKNSKIINYRYKGFKK